VWLVPSSRQYKKVPQELLSTLCSVHLLCNARSPSTTPRAKTQPRAILHLAIPCARRTRSCVLLRCTSILPHLSLAVQPCARRMTQSDTANLVAPPAQTATQEPPVLSAQAAPPKHTEATSAVRIPRQQASSVSTMTGSVLESKSEPAPAQSPAPASVEKTNVTSSIPVVEAAPPASQAVPPASQAVPPASQAAPPASQAAPPASQAAQFKSVQERDQAASSDTKSEDGRLLPGIHRVKPSAPAPRGRSLTQNAAACRE
jgi:hypothetical protein